MRKVLIVGASQAGLDLAHRLLDHGYDVTVATARTSIEVRRSAPPTVGFTLPRVVAAEQRHGLDFWSSQAPSLAGVGMSFRPTSAPRVDFTGYFASPATAIDRRLKAADWLEYFEDKGGKVVIHGTTTGDLDHFSRMFDLVVIAVGGGELGQLFDPDPSRLSGTRPRVVTQLLLEDSSVEDEVRVITAPVGEIYQTPILTSEGIAQALMVAGEPDGPLDPRLDGPLTVETLRRRLAPHVPDVADTLEGAALLPGTASVTRKRVTPIVRDPVAHLPSGGVVLGLGPVLCESDPATGRDTPDETAAAESYLGSIVAHGEAPFDEPALRGIFNTYYQAHGRISAEFTQMISQWWDTDPPEHVRALLGAAQSHQQVADRWVSGFDDPTIYTALLQDPDRAHAFLDQVGALPTA